MKTRREIHQVDGTRGWSVLPTKEECKDMCKKCDNYLKKRGVKINDMPLKESELDEFIENF